MMHSMCFNVISPCSSTESNVRRLEIGIANGQEALGVFERSTIDPKTPEK